jgi:hypothetical protein
MARMVALVPPIARMLRGDFRLLATQAGCYGNGLRVSVQLWRGETMLHPEVFPIDTADHQEAFAHAIRP